MKVKVLVAIGDVVVEHVKKYPAADFEQANRSAEFAARDLVDVVLEALDKAGIRPEPQKGGEDKDVRPVEEE